MNFPDLIKNSARIFVKTRLIWLFAAVYGVYMALVAAMPVTSGTDPQESLRILPLLCGVECLMLLLLPVMLFCSCGMVYTAGQAWRKQPVTLRDTWERFKQRLLSIFLLTLAFIGIAIVLAVIVFILMFVFMLNNTTNPYEMGGAVGIGMVVIMLPFSILVALCYVSLILDPVGGFDALTRGLKRYWSKIGVVILTFLAYFIGFTILQALIGLAYRAAFGAVTLPYPASTGLFGQYMQVMASPAVRLFNIVLFPFLGSLYFIILALIYEDAGGPQTTPPVSVIEPV